MIISLSSTSIFYHSSTCLPLSLASFLHFIFSHFLFHPLSLFSCPFLLSYFVFSFLYTRKLLLVSLPLSTNKSSSPSPLSLTVAYINFIFLLHLPLITFSFPLSSIPLFFLHRYTIISHPALFLSILVPARIPLYLSILPCHLSLHVLLYPS